MKAYRLSKEEFYHQFRLMATESCHIGRGHSYRVWVYSNRVWSTETSFYISWYNYKKRFSSVYFFFCNKYYLHGCNKP